MQVFLNQPWWQMRGLLILLFGKTVLSFVWKGCRQEKKTVLLRLVCYFWKTKEKTSKLNRGLCFSMRVEGHVQKLSSFARVKNYSLE